MMRPVDHLKNLRIFNFILAGMDALAGCFLLLLLCTMGLAMLLPSLFGAPAELVAAAGLGLFSSTFGLFMAVVTFILFLTTARLLPQGRGRIPQTIVAIIVIIDFPVGTLYAAYALWVCWFNAETKARFE